MKKIKIYMLLGLLTVILSGCGKTEKTVSEDINKSQVVESMGNSENDSETTSLHSYNLSDYNVFMEAKSEASLKNLYLDVDEFIESNSSDAIVKGQVSDIEYVFIEGCAYSILTVDVQDVYKGEIGDVIKVYEDGGYARLSDEREYIEPHADLSEYTEEDMNNMLIDHIFMGAEHSQVGDVDILFLKTNQGGLPNDTFRLNCSVFGRYILKDASYVRTEFVVENDNPDGAVGYSVMKEFEVSLPQSVLEEKLSNDN